MSRLAVLFKFFVLHCIVQKAFLLEDYYLARLQIKNICTIRTEKKIKTTAYRSNTLYEFN